MKTPYEDSVNKLIDSLDFTKFFEDLETQPKFTIKDENMNKEEFLMFAQLNIFPRLCTYLRDHTYESFPKIAGGGGGGSADPKVIKLTNMFPLVGEEAISAALIACDGNMDEAIEVMNSTSGYEKQAKENMESGGGGGGGGGGGTVVAAKLAGDFGVGHFGGSDDPVSILMKQFPDVSKMMIGSVLKSLGDINKAKKYLEDNFPVPVIIQADLKDKSQDEKLDILKEFLDGKVKIQFTSPSETVNCTFQDVLKNSDQWWENCHNFIQWVLPTDEPSVHNQYAPVIKYGKQAFWMGSYGKKIEEAADRFIEFLKSPEAGDITLPYNHNRKRITRALKSFAYFGLDENLYERDLCDIMKKVPKTDHVWKNQWKPWYEKCYPEPKSKVLEDCPFGSYYKPNSKNEPKRAYDSFLPELGPPSKWQEYHTLPTYKVEHDLVETAAIANLTKFVFDTKKLLHKKNNKYKAGSDTPTVWTQDITFHPRVDYIGVPGGRPLYILNMVGPEVSYVGATVESVSDDGIITLTEETSKYVNNVPLFPKVDNNQGVILVPNGEDFKTAVTKSENLFLMNEVILDCTCPSGKPTCSKYVEWANGNTCNPVGLLRKFKVTALLADLRIKQGSRLVFPMQNPYANRLLVFGIQIPRAITSQSGSDRPSWPQVAYNISCLNTFGYRIHPNMYNDNGYICMSHLTGELGGTAIAANDAVHKPDRPWTEVAGLIENQLRTHHPMEHETPGHEIPSKEGIFNNYTLFVRYVTLLNTFETWNAELNQQLENGVSVSKKVDPPGATDPNKDKYDLATHMLNNFYAYFNSKCASSSPDFILTIMEYYEQEVGILCLLPKHFIGIDPNQDPKQPSNYYSYSTTTICFDPEDLLKRFKEFKASVEEYGHVIEGYRDYIDDNVEFSQQRRRLGMHEMHEMREQSNKFFTF